MKASSLLGLNARSMLFSYPYNRSKGRKIASSKLKTKRVLKKHGVPVPEVYAKFTKPTQLVKFDWSTLPSAFALKPNKGLGGEGIIIAKKRAKGNGELAWITADKKRVTVEDLKLHILDILEGAYSLRNVPDIAYVDEYIGRHKAFRKYSYRGGPDIRVIVFNKVPVMAMMRLPTKESGGRANLHQGAIAVGIDMATGITTKAYWRGEYILYKPGTKRKLHGIKIPNWNKILKIAVECQLATELGYLGVDLMLHPKKGPMVLELNYMPGLKIQMANTGGLKKRLERVEDLKVRSPEHGVKIAKSIFMSSFADRVRAEEGIKTVRVFEKIKVKGADGKRHRTRAKIDSGAWRTSIDEGFAQEIGLLGKENLLWEKKFRSSLGIQRRKVIAITFWLKGRKISTVASVTTRKHLKYKLIIGRKDLVGFLIKPRGNIIKEFY